MTQHYDQHTSPGQNKLIWNKKKKSKESKEIF